MRMVIGVSMTVDFAFKLVLGSPEHTRVTIHFLNSILDLPSPIKSVTIQNPILGKDDDDDKLSILDILAIDEQGRTINIEMQTTLPAGMTRRLVYHGSRLYSNQLNEGDQYTTLRAAVVVCVLTKPLFTDGTDLHLDFRLRDVSGRTLTNDMQIHLLQLSNLTVTAQNVSRASPIEQWAFFMLNSHKLTVDEVKQLFPDEEFAEAAGVLEMINQTPDQQRQYDARRKLQMDEAARLEYARNEGEAKGRLEGELRGELRGRINTYQELLGIPISPPTDLSQYNEEALAQLAEQLRIQLRNRGPA